jgi:hypothetical protein
VSAAATSSTGVLQGPPRTERAMERVTWLIMGVALVAFMGLALLGSLGLRGAVEYVETPSRVDSVNGIVLYRAAEGSGQESISAGSPLYQGDQLSVSFGSSAALTMADGTRAELSPNARVRVDQARAPRLAGRRSEFQLGIENGAARLAVAPAAPDLRLFQVLTPAGVAQLGEGQYTVRVAPDATRISVWEGRATVLAESQVLEVVPGRKIILRPNAFPEQTDALENIVVNSGFSAKFEGWEPWEQNETRADVKGTTQIVAPTEPNSPGIALRINRESVAQAHNETGLTQKFHRDVTGARAVALDMWLKVDSASLSGGGYLGTEYPLMLRVRYQAQRGNEEVWTRGFFYANPEQRPTANGEQVPKGVWTHYRVDLTQILAVTPAIIEELQVLGAGHSFDASVADLKILVD